MEQEENVTQDNFVESLKMLGWIRRGACLTEPLEQAIHECILSQVQQTIQGELEQEGLFDSVVEFKTAVVVSTYINT